MKWRSISSQGLQLIKRFEGFSATLYLDAAGLPTIGYGHLVSADALSDFGHGLDEYRANELLRQDVRIAERAVAMFIAVELAQHQFDALVSFTFNLGAGVLQRSTLRRVINRGEHEAVPAQLKRFVWAGGRRLPGLVKRRHAEVMLYVK